MPTIDRAALGIKVAQPQAPRLDPGARGFTVNAGAVMAAQQTPTIDARGFVAQAGAAADIGAALVEVGGAAQRIAMERQEINNRRKVLEIESLMVQKRIDIAERIGQTPDDTEWEGIAAKEADNAQKEWLKDLAPAVREEVYARATVWKNNLVAETGRAALGRSMDMLAADLETRRLAAIDGLNVEDAQAATAELLQRGLIRPDVAHRQNADTLEQIERKQREAQREAIVADADAAPDLWKERHREKPDDMEYEDYDLGLRVADRAIQRRTSRIGEEIADAVASDPDLSEEKVREIAGNGLRPAALAEVLGDFQELQAARAKGALAEPRAVSKNFGALLAEAEQYDKEGDTDGAQFVSIMMRTKALLPEELRGEITGPLSKKWTPGSEPEAPETVKSYASQILREWFTDKKFGEYQKEVPLAPSDPGYYPGINRTKLIDDPAKRDEAMTRRADAEMIVRKWLKENPNATITETKAKIREASNVSLLPGEVDRLNKRPPPATAPDPTRMESLLKQLGADPEDITAPGTVRSAAATTDAPAAYGSPLTPLVDAPLRFGGIDVPETGDLGVPRVTVFGGAKDPVDNGLSYFGGKTGKGGREGVAIPKKILEHFYGGGRATWEQARVEATLPDGTRKVLPIADLGTAEWVWKKNGKPVMDLTPGAVEALGGKVLHNKRGHLLGVQGLEGVRFRLLPLEENIPPFSE